MVRQPEEEGRRTERRTAISGSQSGNAARSSAAGAGATHAPSKRVPSLSGREQNATRFTARPCEMGNATMCCQNIIFHFVMILYIIIGVGREAMSDLGCHREEREMRACTLFLPKYCAGAGSANVLGGTLCQIYAHHCWA